MGDALFGKGRIDIRKTLFAIDRVAVAIVHLHDRQPAARIFRPDESMKIAPEKLALLADTECHRYSPFADPVGLAPVR